jgi:hypothetical protein
MESARDILVTKMEDHPHNFWLQLLGNYKTMKNDTDICTEIAGIFRYRLGVKMVSMSRVAMSEQLFNVRCTQPPQAVVGAVDEYNFKNTTRQLKDFLFIIYDTSHCWVYYCSCWDCFCRD